jgi:hypothetical protein
VREFDRRVASSAPSVRRGLLRAVRRVFGALSGAPPSRAVVPARPADVAPTAPEPAPEADQARLRARAALTDARAQMPSLLEERPEASSGAGEHIPAESAVLRQALRSYTDHVEGLLRAADDERRALRVQINRLSEDVLMMRAELDAMRAALPAPPTEQVPALPEHSEQPATGDPSVTSSSPAAASLTEIEPPPPSAADDAGATREPVATTAVAGVEPPVQLPPIPQPPPVVPSEAPLEPDRMRMPAAASLARETREGTGMRGQPPVVSDLAPDVAPEPASASQALPSDESVTPAVEGALPPVPAQPLVVPDAGTSEAEERLAARVFPSGTVGVMVAVWPVASFEKLRSIQDGLAADPLVDRAELLTYEEGEATLRLNFRRAARWPWLRGTVERVAGAPIRPGSVSYERGTISLTLVDPHEPSEA